MQKGGQKLNFLNFAPESRLYQSYTILIREKMCYNNRKIVICCPGGGHAAGKAPLPRDSGRGVLLSSGRALPSVPAGFLFTQSARRRGGQSSGNVRGRFCLGRKAQGSKGPKRSMMPGRCLSPEEERLWGPIVGSAANNARSRPFPGRKTTVRMPLKHTDTFFISCPQPNGDIFEVSGDREF